MSFKAYPEYKDSGVPWLDKIPGQWSIMRAKNIFRTIDVRSKTGLEELLSVSEKKGVTPRKNINVTMFQAESYIGHKLCWPGDLVINSLWAWMQGLGFSKQHGIVSSAYGVYRLNSDLDDDYRYFDYLFRSKVYLWELRVNSKGIWRSRYQLTDDSFFRIPVIIPPKKDRQKITRFLDFKSSQISRFIRAKKRMIKLLKEKKQVIINQAVTRGLDPNVKLKPSGVEWLGEIPEHWEVYRLKRIVKSNIDSLSDNTDSEYEFNYLEINKVKSGYVIDNPVRMKFGESPTRARRKVQKGDTIISTVRTYLRSVLFIDMDNYDDLIVSTGFSVLTPNEKVNPQFLGYLLRCDNFIDRVIQHSIGVSYPAIADTDLIALKVVLPPRTEQSSIVIDIGTKTKKIDLAISRAEREIALMQEYRDRLIADVVTGKVDVREIEVPETFEEELIDDNEDFDEEEILDEEAVEDEGE